MNDTKLKPCPFCGGAATLRKSEETKLYHIACFECGCRQDSSYKAESVIIAWNTRKPMDNIVAGLEIAKEKVAKEDYCRTKHYIENDCEHKDCFKCCAEYLIDIVKAGGAE